MIATRWAASFLIGGPDAIIARSLARRRAINRHFKRNRLRPADAAALLSSLSIVAPQHWHLAYRHRP